MLVKFRRLHTTAPRRVIIRNTMAIGGAGFQPLEVIERARWNGGGIEWMTNDVLPYHVPTLIREVKDMVAESRHHAHRTTP